MIDRAQTMEETICKERGLKLQQLILGEYWEKSDGFLS